MFRTVQLGSAFLALFVLGMVLTWPGNHLPDFSRYPAGAERKQAFFDYMRPVVEAANRDVHEQRRRLLAIAGEESTGFFDRRFIRRLAGRYGVDYDDAAPREALDALLTRVDTVPVSLALAQAAMESAWGTSRFARLGNNLFGEWCFDAGCGIVPNRRAEGRSHEVRAFPTPVASIESYLLNLNTHRAYRELRALRAARRAQGERPSGYQLAAGLNRYSEKGAVYVDEIRQVIRGNALE